MYGSRPNFQYAFNDKQLQKEFEDKMQELFNANPDISKNFGVIGRIDAVSVSRGVYQSDINEFIDNTSFGIQNRKHRDAKHNYHLNTVAGNLPSGKHSINALMRAIRQTNEYIKKRDHRYNVVFYGDLGLGG